MRKMFSLKQLQEIADSEVKSLVESGTLDNAKPIYCHPVYMRNSSGTSRLSGLVLNNDSTPFTFTSFKNWVKNLSKEIGNVRILINGGYYDSDNSKTEIASVFYLESENASPQISGTYTDGTSANVTKTWDSLETEFASRFYDAVNKIN